MGEVEVHQDSELHYVGNGQVLIKNPDGTAVHCFPDGRRVAMQWSVGEDGGIVYEETSECT